MTLEKAMQIFYITEEIKVIKEEMRDADKERTYLKGLSYSDMPKAAGVKDNMAEVDKHLDQQKTSKEMLEYAEARLEKEKQDMEIFLKSLEDAEMRLIIRMRCKNLKSWKEIGKRIHMDRTTVSKKFYNFFKQIN